MVQWNQQELGTYQVCAQIWYEHRTRPIGVLPPIGYVTLDLSSTHTELQFLIWKTKVLMATCVEIDQYFSKCRSQHVTELRGQLHS